LPGKDIAILAVPPLTAGLLQTGLAGELRITVNPVILGQGRSLFAGAGKTGLKLLKTRQFTSGNVLLYYQPVTR
jgi:dihydrofolate reductase